MSIENAKKAVTEAVYQVKIAQVGFGRGAGGRELALAATKVEESEMWLQAAEKARAAEQVSDAGTGTPWPLGSTVSGSATEDRYLDRKKTE